MTPNPSRYSGAQAPRAAEGWTLSRATPPSRLYGANGLRTGNDGRIYVAQVTGSQISALDLKTGALETVSPMGGAIVGPDDIAFDPDGNLYATEVMDARVSVRGTDGRTRVLRDDLPFANGITVFEGRLFVGECRIGGRLMELDLNGGEPRVLLADVPMPNAMEVGPDGLLYFPVMGTNEIWRVHPDGGKPEVVARELGVPDAVKFDANGMIVSTQVASGEVLRVDPRTGEKTRLAALSPGIDNLTFADGRLFVSNFSGLITEILDGGATRAVLPGGLNGPLDLAVMADGRLVIADGATVFALQPDGTLGVIGMLFSPGFPGYVRGLAASGPDTLVVATSGGNVARWQPAAGTSEVLASGLDQLYGIAVAPGDAVVAAELGAGRVVLVRGGGGPVEVLASGLREPVGVAVGADGVVYVCECGAGRVAKIIGTRVETVVDGLQQPQGLLFLDGVLYVVDAGSKSVVSIDPRTKSRKTIASDLPVGAPPGVTPKPLRGLPPFSGPHGPLAGIAAGPDGTLYVSGDADGSVLALRRA